MHKNELTAKLKRLEVDTLYPIYRYWIITKNQLNFVRLQQYLLLMKHTVLTIMVTLNFI